MQNTHFFLFFSHFLTSIQLNYLTPLQLALNVSFSFLLVEHKHTHADISLLLSSLKIAAECTGPVTRQSLADFEDEASLPAAASATTVKLKELRDKIKLLVPELRTNTVDSPHVYG
ncbi:unnamed protein product [Rotaria sp. Silwood2]|nr:unnamed protein product [Rotaria sp. Silwood2]CAF2767451.1 unnamed protein product [Rotaria sp. Silwood2]CAF3188412.1 unnamed protein product [Rotaria sp. Silwood2]CAF3238518.1 unnamed protein product [Rotaria sp. Silwood2]CAF4023903.1 unnamed protein product [Rotaria sp. Silwood2]